MKIEITESNASRYFATLNRAKTLVAQGYRFEEFATSETAFYCFTPSGNAYTVLTNAGRPDVAPYCSCPDFQKNGDFCKHVLCAGAIVEANDAAKWEAICEEVDARAAYEVA